MLLLAALCLRLADDRQVKPAPPAAPAPLVLFNGRDTTEWKTVAITGSGTLSAADGCLKLGAGTPLSLCRVAAGDKLPKTDYEIEFEARRDEGSDLFACLTFQVGAEQASLAIGGWGGRTCGLSSINGADASENETSKSLAFENGKWYRIKLRVAGRRISAWIDGEKLFDYDATDTMLSTRIEVAGCAPLGLATYRTAASWRKLELRRLPKSAP